MPEVGHSTPYHHTLARTEKLLNRTYLLPPQLVDRLDAVARENSVGVSDLVRFLINEALFQVETGELVIPTRPQRLQLIVHDDDDSSIGE